MLLLFRLPVLLWLLRLHSVQSVCAASSLLLLLLLRILLSQCSPHDTDGGPQEQNWEHSQEHGASDALASGECLSTGLAASRAC